LRTGIDLRRAWFFPCALGSSLLLVLSFPGPGLWFLAFCALVPLLLAVRGASARSAFLLGWLCGLAWFGISLCWLAETIHLYGSIPFLLAWILIGLMAAFLGLFTALFALLARAAGSLPAPLSVTLLAGGWTLIESVRIWFPAPFPWLQLGAAFSGVPPASFLLGLVGVAGLTLLTAGVNALLFHGVLAWRCGGRGRALIFPAAALLILMVTAAAGRILAGRPASGAAAVKVAVAQGNFTQGELWDPGNRETILAAYVALTRDAAGRGARLVAWPESSLPFYYQAQPGVAGRLRALARELGIHLVFGSVGSGPPGSSAAGTGQVLHVSAFHIAPDGSEERYDKTRLVPFGEYVPFRRLLFFVDKLVAEVGDFVPGRWEKPFSTPVPGGGLICYEVAFSDIPRREVRGGARLLINLTNDAWYGTSWGPYQHLAFASLRAAENGMPLLRAANTGISAVYDGQGREIGRLGLFTRGVIVAEVPVNPAPRPYVRWGDAPVVAISLFMTIIGLTALLAAARKGSER
jgi:apolipoprotein N-acyltransferase